MLNIRHNNLIILQDFLSQNFVPPNLFQQLSPCHISMLSSIPRSVTPGAETVQFGIPTVYLQLLQTMNISSLLSIFTLCVAPQHRLELTAQILTLKTCLSIDVITKNSECPLLQWASKSLSEWLRAWCWNRWCPDNKYTNVAFVGINLISSCRVLSSLEIQRGK